jgi:hypothetical protein
MPTFEEVVKALDRCMTIEPPVNYALSPDASQLGTVFAEMQYFQQSERPLEDFKPKQREAFERWKY